MRLVIIINILFLCVLLGCDNSEDIFFVANEKPILTFKKLEPGEKYQTSIYDSLKIINDSVYSFKYKLLDELSIETFDIDYNFSLGNGTIEFSTDSMILFRPETTGINNFSITLTDIYGEYTSANASVFVFENLLPVAVLNVTQDNDNYTFDCSESYDNDSNFGGQIVNYKLSISNAIVVNSENPVISYNGLYFENPFVVKLQVVDNNGGLSTEISRVVHPN